MLHHWRYCPDQTSPYESHSRSSLPHSLERARWIKLYLKRGEDVGFVLIENVPENHALRLGQCVQVEVCRAVGPEIDKMVSSLICTRGVGLLAASNSEVIITSRPDAGWTPARFSWDQTSCSTSIVESHETLQAAPVMMRVRLRVICVGEPYRHQSKKEQQWVRVKDRHGVCGSILLASEQCGIVGLDMGDEVVLSGFSLAFHNGRFTLFLGSNSTIEIVPSSENQRVPMGTERARTIESVLDAINNSEQGVLALFTVNAQITAIDLARSVFASCASCKMRQKLNGACKRCSSPEFEGHKFDIQVSAADESGQWSKLRLRDPIASRVLNTLPTEPDLAAASQQLILSWAVLGVGVTRSKAAVTAEIVQLHFTG